MLRYVLLLAKHKINGLLTISKIVWYTKYMGKLVSIFIAFLISLFLWKTWTKMHDFFMSDKYCSRCGGKLFNSDCGFCLDNSNALREFEDQDE